MSPRSRSTSKTRAAAEQLPRIEVSRKGAVAQLGERLNGIQEVSGSTPLGSTISPLDPIHPGPLPGFFSSEPGFLDFPAFSPPPWEGLGVDTPLIPSNLES